MAASVHDPCNLGSTLGALWLLDRQGIQDLRENQPGADLSQARPKDPSEESGGEG